MPNNQQLRRRLADAEFPLSVAARADLRRSVDDYVDSVKALDWPPERVIVALKRIAHEAGLAPSPHLTPIEWGMSARDDLLVDLVGWSIERYYDLTVES